MRLLIWVALVGMSRVALAEDCARLAKVRFDHARVTVAEVVTGTLTPEGGKALEGLPGFCRVAAVIDPSGDSAIKVEVWLPLTGWNERMLGTGNGGLAGRINYGTLAGGVKQGYAVANTDMGTAAPVGQDAGVFVGRPERWADWGWRSTHEMTLFTKAVVRAFYGRAEKKDYFMGCSTGGEQALMEAQRFPEDYDGIVGGAPAHNRTGVHESILWNFAAVEGAPGAYLPEGKLKLLNAAVVKACDLNDGVQDGVIGDPRACHFDPGVLACKEGDGEDCLTAAQVGAVRKVYAGPRDSRNGRSIYPGLERGSEFAWGSLGPVPPANKAPYAPLFEWVFGEDWDWRRFDYGRDVDTVQTKLAATLNATDPNLDRFVGMGHKLVMFHGWADQIVPPRETIAYVDAVRARREVDGAVRLFLLPGVQHCSGGPGPSTIDPLAAVVSWVELGKAPERILATGAGVTRPLCPYPAEAKYQGTGDVNDPAAYACAVRK